MRKKKNKIVPVDNKTLFQPSSKKQEQFLNSKAFITCFGGAAMSGKTYQGLMRFLWYVDKPNFSGYVVRKNATDFKKGGGALKKPLRCSKPTNLV